MLKPVKIDWAWLQDNLNLIIDRVNRQKPLSSSTIAIDEMPSGTMLSLTASQGGGGGGGGVWDPRVGWQLLTVIDDSSGTCVNKYIWYWGTAVADSPGNPPSMPH